MKLNQVKKGDLIKVRSSGQVALVKEKDRNGVFLKPPFKNHNGCIKFSGYVRYNDKYEYYAHNDLKSYCKVNKKDLQFLIKEFKENLSFTEEYLKGI